MTTYLKWTQPQGDEQVYILTADEVLIGRKSDANIILPNPNVSRHHAKLIKGKEGYSVVDLPNTQGTYVNGRQVKQQELLHGDIIWLGRDRTDLHYLTPADDFEASAGSSATDEQEKFWADLSLILPSNSPKYSDLEKLSSLLEFQYQWEKTFSAESTFQQILIAALKISRAERGYILLKRRDRFEHVSGLSESGKRLSEWDFQTSQSVARQVASDGKPVYSAEGLRENLLNNRALWICTFAQWRACPRGGCLQSPTCQR